MKRYYDKVLAPLKFHKFFWYVMLPVWFVRSLVGILSVLSDMQSFDGLFAIDIVYYILSATLMVMSFVGFFGWKPYAWYSILGYFIVITAHTLHAMIVYWLHAPVLLETAGGQLISVLLYSIFIGLYYIKRRPLFFSGTPRGDMDAGANEAKKLSQPSCCHECGAALLPESEFCSQCGVWVAGE